MSRFASLGALLLLGACTIYSQPDDPESVFNDPSVQECLSDTIEICYAQQLSPDACAALIDANCLGGMPQPPGDPGDCFEQVFADCVAAGVDEMTCWAIADQQCNNQPPGCDPATGANCCDPATGMCPPPPCDPMTDPNCPPDPPPMCDPATGVCCDAAGVCCEPNGMCWPPDPPEPCDPMTDPMCPPGCNEPNGCPPPPMCDPATGICCDAMGVCCNPAGVCCAPFGTCWPQDPPPMCDPMTDPNCPPEPPPEPCPNDPMCNGMP